MSNQESQQILGQILRDSGLDKYFMTRQPTYQYWHIGEHQYFWTTETIAHKGKKRYVSGIYKHSKKDKTLRLTHESYHAKRKDAKDRAYKLYAEARKKWNKDGTKAVAGNG